MYYKTIKCQAKASFVEKHSEFLSYISPVSTIEKATEFIESIKKEHRKASHNVYAYLLREGNISRYSDDGEPQGTAGMPILDVLRKKELTDVCIVVTRYFGGTLLGGGGLVRAYTHSAVIACEAAEILSMYLCRNFQIIIDYSLYGKINLILQTDNVIIKSLDFCENIHINIAVKENSAENFFEELIEITNGKVSINKINCCYENFD